MGIIPKVLIVDDEYHIRSFIKVLMRPLNFEIVGEASNGEEAFKLTQKLNPDIVLLDIHMPISSGLEVLPKIKKNRPSALVVMLTSIKNPEMMQFCLNNGAKNYILKNNAKSQFCNQLKLAWENHLTDEQTSDIKPGSMN